MTFCLQWITPGFAVEINQKTSKENLEMEMRWVEGLMENGCQIEQGDKWVRGIMQSDNEACYLLFVGTKIKNNRDKILNFSLKDFRVEVGQQVLTPSAYVVNRPVFIATSKNVQFQIEPGEEKRVGVGFKGLAKTATSLRFIFLDLPPISFAKPVIE
jgi:hypothetical protein